MCWLHYDRTRKRQSVSAPKNESKAGTMTPLQRLTEAALVYRQVSSEDDKAWRRALDNLCASAERYVTKLWADRSRELQLKAKRKGKRIGRPVAKKGPSRWTLWRKRKFREVLDRSFAGAPRSR